MPFPKPQLSLAATLGWVGFFAVGCAALAKPTFFWAGLLWSLVMATLGAALLAAIFRTGASRAFWVGFALFGWGHMTLALAPLLEDLTGELIFTRQILDSLARLIGHDVPSLTQTDGIWKRLPLVTTSRGYVYPAYLVIGQSWLTIVIATCGGFVATYFHARQWREG